MPIIGHFPFVGGKSEPEYSSWFGTGEDGDLTVTEDTALDVILDEGQIVKQYNNLTVAKAGILHPANRCNGMILLVKGDLTVDGTIHVDKCAPLLNEGEMLAAQERHIALCGALTGGNGGDAGMYAGGGSGSATGMGLGGAGFTFGGGFGGGSSSGRTNSTCGYGANGDRPPAGSPIPYPAPGKNSPDENAMYGAGGTPYSSYPSINAVGGGGPGGSGGVARTSGSQDPKSANGKNGNAIGGGGLWIFVQGAVRIGETGVLSAGGGPGGQGAYVYGYNNYAASGGGGGGGGGIIALVHTGDLINSGAIRASGGDGGAKANESEVCYPGNAGTVGTIFIKAISELLAQ